MLGLELRSLYCINSIITAAKGEDITLIFFFRWKGEAQRA